MKKVSCLAAGLGAFLFALLPSAAAGERTLWVGRDVDDASIHWTCTNTVGDNWTLKKNGRHWAEYEEVARTAEYVELQAKGVRSFERIRLTRDNLSMNKNGSRFQWATMARGKWTN